MRKTFTFVIAFFPLASVFGQWQYVNPTAIGTGSAYLLQTSVAGQTNTNSFYNKLWLQGTATTGSANSWSTTQLVNGISVDASFNTPTTSRSWWMRFPQNDIQAWGDQGKTYMTLQSGKLGLGTSSPGYKFDLHTTGSLEGVNLESNAGGGSRFLRLFTPSMPVGAYNNITRPNDTGFAFGGTASGNADFGFVIAPWASANSGLRISNSGDVGIGVSYPKGQLHISTSDESLEAAIAIRQENNDAFGFDFGLDENNNGNFFLFRVFNDQRYPVMEFNRDQGTVGMGHAPVSGYTLAVAGKTLTDEVNVKVTSTWDKVFEKEYSLPALESVKIFIDQNKHLPEVPSAKEMEANGINLSEMNMLLLKKVEELTLYVIEQQKEIDGLKSKIK
jgi:hypothetical protein